MDFLGLRNLTVLEDAIQMVHRDDPNFDLHQIPEDDAATFEMISAGRTSGVFQMESTGMTNVCVNMKPQNIEDITAIIALYRPGPMESIPRFIECKHHPEKITYLHKSLEPILGVTYAYQTAYFKCHYTKEYMAALLTSVLDNSDKVAEYIAECKECGIKLLPPDINFSNDSFTVEEGGIRFGLVAIKNIGRGFIQAVMRERTENGRFSSMQNFCERMYGADINKRALENLILSGAFDSTGAKRSQLHKVYEQVLSGVVENRRQNLEGQLDFFGGFAAENTKAASDIPLPDIPEFTAEERMRQEKETTGLYLSGHPMDAYCEIAKAAGAAAIGSIIEDCNEENGPNRFADGQRITIAGVVTSSKTKTTKNNTLMAYVVVEDSTASIELLCFSKVLSASGSYFSEGKPLLIQGKLSLRDEKTPQIICDEASPLDNQQFLMTQSAPAQKTEKILQGRRLVIKCPSINDPVFRHIQLVIKMFPGTTPLITVMADTGRRYGANCLLHKALVDELKEVLGDDCVVIQ